MTWNDDVGLGDWWRAGHEFDKSSAIPYYVQVAQILRTAIDRGDLAPGSQIPSESALCATFEVSRTVVRQAVGELQNEGSVETRKGVGSFVALNKRVDHLAESLVGLKEDAASNGYELTDRVLTCEIRPAGQRVARILGIDEGADIVMLERARSLDGDPYVLVRSFLPADLCGPVANYDLTDRSLYDVLARDLDLRIIKATRSLEATAASDFVARWLEVEEDAPVLLLKSTSFLVTGRPVEYFIAWHRSDRSRFEVHLERDTGGTAVTHADVVAGFRDDRAASDGRVSR